MELLLNVKLGEFTPKEEEIFNKRVIVYRILDVARCRVYTNACCASINQRACNLLRSISNRKGLFAEGRPLADSRLDDLQLQLIAVADDEAAENILSSPNDEVKNERLNAWRKSICPYL